MSDSDEPYPPLLRQLLVTLADFEAVEHPAVGAVIYPRSWAGTDLPRNLMAGVMAAVTRLSSLDGVLRRYVPETLPQARTAADASFGQIGRLCEEHMTAAVGRLADEGPASAGVQAAYVALVRAMAGYDAMRVLYGLGLNLEGDAVARQLLEQIAWACKAASVSDPAELKRIRGQSSLSALKAVLPEEAAGLLGRLYGKLSGSAHAQLAHHAAAVTVEDDGSFAIVLQAIERQNAAEKVFVLSELWAVAFEWTQRHRMKSFEMLDAADYTLMRQRPHAKRIHGMIANLKY